MMSGMEMSMCEKDYRAGSAAKWHDESYCMNIATNPVICL